MLDNIEDKNAVTTQAFPAGNAYDNIKTWS